jgi:hypothetical protein
MSPTAKGSRVLIFGATGGIGSALVLRMKSRSKLIPIMAAFGTFAGLIAIGCGTVRVAYESAPYRLVRSDGEFELRDYPVLPVAETPMARGSNGSDGSFNRLFRFITGANEANQNISMTTPVFMSGCDTNAKMAIVMPAKMKTGEVAKPLDPSVTLGELPAGRFAVLRYGTGGIGSEVSRRLRGQGAEVALAARNEARLEEARPRAWSAGPAPGRHPS